MRNPWKNIFLITIIAVAMLHLAVWAGGNIFGWTNDPDVTFRAGVIGMLLYLIAKMEIRA